MNICIATSSFPINRKEIYHHYIEDLIKILLENTHTVTILTQDKKGEKENLFSNVEVIWFPWKMTEKNVLAEISLRKYKNIISTFSLLFNGIKYCRKLTKEKNIDIFICHWIIPSGFYVFIKNIFFARTPYILWSLGSDVYKYKNNIFTRMILKFIINNSKAVFADGYELCEIIKEISKKDCLFLPTFHEIEVPENIEHSENKEKQTTSFLYVGRLSHVKGIDILINAFKYLNKNHNPNFICNIVGDGELLQSLSEMVKHNNLENKIFFKGRIADNGKLSEFFLNADCVLLPSRSESIPIVLSEALQFNLPLIVTDVGDMGKIVNENNIGYVVPSPEHILFAEALARFIKNPVRLDKNKTNDITKKLLFKYNYQCLLDSLNLIEN
ncbi:MAG: glycosyltransferase [Bacteroidales bacterium]|jgi:glycosyltransferase involved in cell wall biosynthesis